ncbi:COG1180: Radical SAM, Pyruvate-formate lyase-activating enzyme like [hydrothermal vent metagenome]|uniref:COG1180: Radical SAM, Pyruvate-formate lyase-activating enzyme like n=1 Tax=hydrothermal vent metagenome TaxID=652676 RepID=A0A3B0YAK6_9ZZZZ
MQKPILAYTIGNKRYLNITDRCTLRCTFCPKYRVSPCVHEFDLSLPQRPETSDIIHALGNPADYEEIVFCGFGEPTLRLKPLLEIAGYIKQHNGRIRLNTDGLANLFHKRNVLPELADCIDALSVSMNAHNKTVYDQHCQPALPGAFNAMLDFLQLAPDYIEEVTATAIDGLDGVDIDACREMAEQRKVSFRRRVLDVVG